LLLLAPNEAAYFALHRSRHVFYFTFDLILIHRRTPLSNLAGLASAYCVRMLLPIEN
jgi:hypothetical protein